MSTDTLMLLAIVGLFWIAYWVVCLILRHTWTPMIPILPLAFVGLGWLLNKLYPWVGTSTVAALHLALLVKMAKDAWHRPPSGEDGRPPA